MKSILIALGLVAALAAPSLAQQTAGQASQISQKGVARAMSGTKIIVDTGRLLSKGGFRPYTMNFGKNLYNHTDGSALKNKGVSLRDRTNLSYGKGAASDPNLKGNFRPRGSAVAMSGSQYFHATRHDWRGIRAHVPGIESAVRETLTYHFAWKGGSFGLPVLDTVAKDNWYLRMACTPKLKKETENKYTAQVACYGRLGNSAQQLPVVVQFTLLGNEKNWKIQGLPTVISANRLVRPGQNVMANVWAEETAPAASETENSESFSTNQ